MFLSRRREHMIKYFRLGEVLLNENLITQTQLEEALSHQQIHKTRLGQSLVDLGFVSDRDIKEALARKLNVEFIESPLY